MRIAVIDLGSTSFHLLVADVDDRGRMGVHTKRRHALHLAAAVSEDGHLPKEPAAEALRAARSLRRTAERTKPDLVVAAATSALREASNGADLLSQLQTALRSPIRLLDGLAEGELVYAGVRAGLDLGDEPVVVCDLGGGSLELVCGAGEKVLIADSFPLGASRLTARFVRNDPLTPAEQREISDLVVEECRAVLRELRSLNPLPFVATGGTARAVGRLVAERRGADVGGLVVPAAELYGLATNLLSLPRRRRLRLPGMPAGRVDVLPAGALVLATVAEQLDAGAMTVSSTGLREGLVLEALGLNAEIWRASAQCGP